MSATNLDLPVLISAEQIRRREFVTTRRGYDADQVRAYLEQLADQVESMESMLREARMQVEAASRADERPAADPYERLASRVSGLIREADEAAETIRRDAGEDAERMTREARADADRIRTDAQARAEEARAQAEAAVEQARADAHRTIAGLASHRAALVGQLGSMQERLLAVANDLERTIEIDETQIGMPDLPVSSIAPADPPGGSPPAEDVVDVTDGLEPSAGSPGAPSNDELFTELDDPAYEELWEGTEGMRLEVPEIPPLDLDWGEDGDDLDDLRD